MNWVVGLAVTAFVTWLIIDAYFKHEPNICSLEYRDAYLKTHDNDDELRRECPSEPWYRTD
jgi:hypothetical protein